MAGLALPGRIEETAAMQPIAEALSRVTLGAPQQFENLTLFPLIAGAPATPDYLLLDEALGRDLATVGEVSEHGSVPELRFTNKGGDRVLLVDGEELVGARQNRILNVTILVGGGQQVVIPVSCVEQGRWAYRSRRFTSGKGTLFASARGKKTRQVSAALRASGSRRADQAEIWSDISAKSAALRVESATEAMADIYRDYAVRIEAYVKAFAPRPGQAGAVFAVNGRVAGAELFDSDITFLKFMAKLIRGYAMDAIEDARADAGPSVEEAARRFLENIKAAALQRFPALAEGEDLRLESDTVAGGALCVDGRVVHLCAFAVGGGSAAGRR
jgi:hypothetical protein